MLKVSNLNVYYHRVIQALRGVSFEVPNGKIVSLLGSNGAGKSTALNAISNILSFQNGEITDVIDMPSMADGKKNKRQINSQQVFNEVSERIINIPKKEITIPINIA